MSTYKSEQPHLRNLNANTSLHLFKKSRQMCIGDFVHVKPT